MHDGFETPTAQRRKTAENVPAHQIVWQSARNALSAAGWMPLVIVQRSEHWVRFNQRCILLIECTEEHAEDAKPDNTYLSGARYVEFCEIGEVLIAST
jgi:hypothetical protein